MIEMSLPHPTDQARRFARVREAHRTEMQEDYVELIGDLIAATGEARATDLAERFGVTAATVANTLARLKRAGLIEMQPYRSIFLTAKGKSMASSSRKRHAIVVDFLLSLGCLAGDCRDRRGRPGASSESPKRWRRCDHSAESAAHKKRRTLRRSERVRRRFELRTYFFLAVLVLARDEAAFGFAAFLAAGFFAAVFFAAGLAVLVFAAVRVAGLAFVAVRFGAAFFAVDFFAAGFFAAVFLAVRFGSWLCGRLGLG